MKKIILLSAFLLTLLLLASCGNNSSKQTISPEEAKQIAKEAYVYGFPMVVNYKTMYMYTIDKNSPEYKGEFNELACDARVYTPEDKAVVTPNSDTPYCMFWVDLRNEPQVITVPKIENGRFYHFQLIDLYTHNFAYIGTLTNDNKAGKYLVVTNDWQGEKPEGINDIIQSETSIFFVIVRTQLFDENDLENVKRIQDDYQMQSLSEYLGTESSSKSEEDDFPVWNEGDQFTTEAFTYLDFMLKLVNPVAEEKELLEKFKKLGIGTEKKFDLADFDKDTQKAIEEGVKEGFAEVEAFIAKETSDPLVSAKIFGTREFLMESAKNNYQLDKIFILRTAAAHQGLYGNSGAEAIYPSYLGEASGVPFDASKNKYTLTFKKDEFPPVKSFWSLTLYDAKTQLLVDNPLDRYLLNSSMMEDYVLGKNGSLTFYIQKDSPGKELENNWLPAPDGTFYTVLRLYGPEKAALEGEWINPPMIRIDQ
jgi:hypothetical protein